MSTGRVAYMVDENGLNPYYNGKYSMSEIEDFKLNND